MKADKETALINTSSELTILAVKNGYIIQMCQHNEFCDPKKTMIAKDLNEVKQIFKKHLNPINVQ